MSEILQTQQGQDVRYGCSLTGQPRSGHAGPRAPCRRSFVDTQVQFGATVTVLEEDLAGVGSTDTTWRPTSTAHSRGLRHGLPHRGGLLQSEPRRRTPPLRSPSARRSPPWRRTPPAVGAVRRAATSCPTWRRSCRRAPTLQKLATGAVSDPIDDNGDVPVGADHQADADVLQRGQGGGGERRAGQGERGGAEGAHAVDRPRGT